MPGHASEAEAGPPLHAGAPIPLRRLARAAARVPHERQADQAKGIRTLPVILGDRAFIKAEGVDAKLEGEVLLTAASLDAIKAKGEIRLKDGMYTTSGAPLAITRGRVVFDGGPADKPNLDVLALARLRKRRNRPGSPWVGSGK